MVRSVGEVGVMSARENARLTHRASTTAKEAVAGSVIVAASKIHSNYCRMNRRNRIAM
jgi:hypothetical protein